MMSTCIKARHEKADVECDFSLSCDRLIFVHMCVYVEKPLIFLHHLVWCLRVGVGLLTSSRTFVQWFCGVMLDDWFYRIQNTKIRYQHFAGTQPAQTHERTHNATSSCDLNCIGRRCLRPRSIVRSLSLYKCVFYSVDSVYFLTRPWLLVRP